MVQEGVKPISTMVSKWPPSLGQNKGVCQIMPIGGISEPTVNFCQFGLGNFRRVGSDFVAALAARINNPD